MGSRVVIDQQALATGCVHWKRTVPYSNVVIGTAQTICTEYKENIVVLESGYFFDYLSHWNWFLLSLLIFNLFLYVFFNSRGRVPLAGNSPRAEKSHRQVQKVTLAGLKSHTRAKIILLECYNTSFIIFNVQISIISLHLNLYQCKYTNPCWLNRLHLQRKLIWYVISYFHDSVDIHILLGLKWNDIWKNCCDWTQRNMMNISSFVCTAYDIYHNWTSYNVGCTLLLLQQIHALHYASLCATCHWNETFKLVCSQIIESMPLQGRLLA